MGLAVPAANLLVAEVNPGRRSATLNLLNFCWSAGAVACPFLVAAAAKSHTISVLSGGRGWLRASGGDWDRSRCPVHCPNRLRPRALTRKRVGQFHGGTALSSSLVRCFFYMSASRTVSADGLQPMPRVWESDAGAGAYDSVILLCRAHAGAMAGASSVATDRRNSPGAGGITWSLARVWQVWFCRTACGG